MRIISRRKLREFWEFENEAEVPLNKWFRFVEKAVWQNPADLKNDYPQADLVGECIVFNIGGNKFRLVVKVKFRWQIVYVRFVLTHEEYDKNIWKADCGG